jgi:hypothetical protein
VSNGVQSNGPLELNGALVPPPPEEVPALDDAVALDPTVLPADAVTLDEPLDGPRALLDAEAPTAVMAGMHTPPWQVWVRGQSMTVLHVARQVPPTQRCVSPHTSPPHVSDEGEAHPATTTTTPRRMVARKPMAPQVTSLGGVRSRVYRDAGAWCRNVR